MADPGQDSAGYGRAMLDLGALGGVRATDGRVMLRPATVSEVALLAERLPDDYELDPTIPGSDDPEQRSLALVRTVERDLAAWRPGGWKLHLIASSQDGTDIGMQTIEAEAFARNRAVDSASWLAREARGRGLGRAMRSAMLALAFDGLLTETAVTSAWSDNGPSLGVSASLGYRRVSVEGRPRGKGDGDLVHLELRRADWLRSAWAAVRLSGLDPARALFIENAERVGRSDSG